MQLLEENKPGKAIELYREHLSICPKNHVAWLNLGVAYMLLCDKGNAEPCFKKALEINPKYEMARNNLRILEHATPENIKRMAGEFRVKTRNKGKHRVINLEDTQQEHDIFDMEDDMFYDSHDARVRP